MNHRTEMRRAGALLAIALLAVPAACKKKDAADAEAGAEPESTAVVAVKVAKVERGDVSDAMTAVGTVSAKQEAIVSTKVSAPIVSMGLLKGRFVRAGETIASLEARDLRAAATEADAAVREADAALRQTRGGTNPEASSQKSKALRDAEANVRNAEALYRRRQLLFSKGGIPKKDLDDAELALRTAQNELELARRESSLTSSTINPTNAQIAESRLDQARGRASNARAQLDYANVRSPISGLVTEQFHMKGDYVAAGDKIVTVTDISQVVIKAQFPDAAIEEVHVGANAKIEPSASPEEPLYGTVQMVNHTVDPASRTVEVWISVVNEDARLRSGEFAKITIVTDEAAEVLTVPPSAVTFDDPTEDTGKVMIVDDASVAHEVEVTVGVRGEDAFEIKEGLEEGQTVIVEGNYALPDGTKVRTVEAESDEEGDEKKDEGDAKDAGDAKGDATDEGGDKAGAKDEGDAKAAPDEAGKADKGGAKAAAEKGAAGGGKAEKP